MLRAGGKNYFFDVKQASNGSNYLTITDSYKNQKGESVTNKVLIFKDHAQEFAATLQEAGEYLKWKIDFFKGSFFFQRLPNEEINSCYNIKSGKQK